MLSQKQAILARADHVVVVLPASRVVGGPHSSCQDLEFGDKLTMDEVRAKGPTIERIASKRRLTLVIYADSDGIPEPARDLYSLYTGPDAHAANWRECFEIILLDENGRDVDAPEEG